MGGKKIMKKSDSTEPKPTKKRRNIILAAIGGSIIFCCGCLAVIALLPDSTDEDTVSQVEITDTVSEIKPSETLEIPPSATSTIELLADTNTPIPIPSPTPVTIAPEYSVIVENKNAMTDVQWEKFFDELEGQKVVEWQGWVVEVVEESGGKYEIWIDMDSPDDIFSTQDVKFEISEQYAFVLLKDQEITFSGVINRVSDFLGFLFTLENVIIHDPIISSETISPENTLTPENGTPSSKIAPSYSEIYNNYTTMTDVQWDKFSKELEGQLVVDWQGWIDEVEQESNGKYEIRIDMDSPSETWSVQDVTFEIAMSEDTALLLQKDQQIVFSGTISRVSDILGTIIITLEEPTINE
jgi:hypothetical protein